MNKLNNYDLDKWISECHTCERCNRVMTEMYGSGRFCSRSCASGHPVTQETREKIKEALLGNTPWNKGLSIDDSRVRKNVEKSTSTKIERYGSAFPNNNMNAEHKRKIGDSNKGKSNKYKGKKRPSEVGEKVSKSKMGHEVSEETREKLRKAFTGKKYDKKTLEIKLSKEYLTKKKNNTFNTSKPESDFYNKLLLENSTKTIFRNYKDKDRYPFYCDFYIVEDDLFIELNFHWTHGGKPFDPNDKECQEKLAIWQEKSKTSQFYKNAIQTWTVRDVEKQKIAKENNLNYKAIY